jgi:hypothetical protein
MQSACVLLFGHFGLEIYPDDPDLCAQTKGKFETHVSIAALVLFAGRFGNIFPLTNLVAYTQRIHPDVLCEYYIKSYF